MKKVGSFLLTLLLVGCATHSNIPAEPFEPLTQLTAKGDNWVVLIHQDNLILHSPKHYNDKPVTKTLSFEQEFTGTEQIFRTHMPSIKLPVSLTIRKAKCQSIDGEIMPFTAVFTIMGVFNKEGCAVPTRLSIPTMEEETKN